MIDQAWSDTLWHMPISDQVCPDLRVMMLRLAGEAGQASLARSGDSAGLRASVDQHAAQVRDALTQPGRALTQAALLSYAQGFTEAAIGRGWSPPHHRETEHRALDPFAPETATLDWESLRLAAVCRLLIETYHLPA